MAYIEIRNIRKSFDGAEVLRGDSLSIGKGQIISIIGDSGNGKTTFLRCLCGLCTPEEGEIEIDGETVFPVPKGYDYYQNVGLVFQNYNLFPQYSVLGNVTLSLNLDSERRLKSLPRRERGKRMKEEMQKNRELALSLLEKVKLTDKKGMFPFQLSGGQQQRVAIARALARKPKILCFDEPTSALDPMTKMTIEKVMLSLKEEGQTMLIVSHDLDFVKSVSDVVYFMSEGVFVEGAEKNAFFSEPKTEKLKAFLSSNSEKKDTDAE